MSKRVVSGVLCLAIGAAALTMTGCPKEEAKKTDGGKAATPAAPEKK